MNQPFIHSSGTQIAVDTFEFICEDYYSDVFVFGDSYVNSSSPARWPYYTHAAGYQFLCDGLPGGGSKDGFDFINAAFSIHQPKYAIWCLGMNDKSDEDSIANENWKNYVEKVKDLCAKNNVTLIFLRSLLLRKEIIEAKMIISGLPDIGTLILIKLFLMERAIGKKEC